MSSAGFLFPMYSPSLIFTQIKSSYINICKCLHFSNCFMFRLCRNYLGSGSSTFLMLYNALCLINFLSSLILISFSFNSFSFSLRISNFFSSSSRLWWSSLSTLWIFSCQCLSLSLFSLSKFAISSSSYDIISGVTMGCAFLVFYFSLFWANLASISLIFVCLTMYCSWFFLRILSFSMSFSFRTFDSSLTLASCSLSLSILSWYSSSFLMTFNAFVCSFLTFSSAYFSSSRALSYPLRFFSSSYLLNIPRLS